PCGDPQQSSVLRAAMVRLRAHRGGDLFARAEEAERAQVAAGALSAYLRALMMNLTILDNGLKVASRTMPGVETVAVGLYAEAGSRHEPARVNGIAHLFEHMVFKGAGGRSARELSEAIEDVGGDLNACTERDQTSFTASLLAEHLPLGIELISDMILRPGFAAEDLEREKEVVRQELAEATGTPGDIIFDDLWLAAWP